MFNEDPKWKSLFEMVVREMETAQGREDSIRHLRSHPNYTKVLALARQLKKDLEVVPDQEPKRKTMVVCNLMEKAPEKMTARELAWLLYFTVTLPAYTEET